MHKINHSSNWIPLRFYFMPSFLIRRYPGALECVYHQKYWSILKVIFYSFACSNFFPGTLVSNWLIDRIFIFVLIFILIPTLNTGNFCPFLLPLLPISFSYLEDRKCQKFQKKHKNTLIGQILPNVIKLFTAISYNFSK